MKTYELEKVYESLKPSREKGGRQGGETGREREIEEKVREQRGKRIREGRRG